MEPAKPKQNHKAIGERSEAIIMARLLEVGYSVLMPFGAFSVKQVGWMKENQSYYLPQQVVTIIL